MSETIPITDPIQIADEHIEGGYGCGQAVLAAFAHRYGLSRKEARSIASCFGGGVGRSGQVCGAVSGVEKFSLMQPVITGPQVITGGAFGPEAGLIFLPFMLLMAIAIYYLHLR